MDTPRKRRPLKKATKAPTGRELLALSRNLRIPPEVADGLIVGHKLIKARGSSDDLARVGPSRAFIDQAFPEGVTFHHQGDGSLLVVRPEDLEPLGDVIAAARSKTGRAPTPRARSPRRR